jgi:hypothetical protein
MLPSGYDVAPAILICYSYGHLDKIKSTRPVDIPAGYKGERRRRHGREKGKGMCWGTSRRS